MLHFYSGCDSKFLTTVNMVMPSLKSLAVLAIQKHYGGIGNNGELLDGISEEKLRNLIGYKCCKTLF